RSHKSEIATDPAARRGARYRQRRGKRGWTSEVPFALLALHRSRLVAVDEAAGALGCPHPRHLFDDGVQGGRGAGHGSAQRVATQGAKPHHPDLLHLAGTQRHPVVIAHYESAVALDDWARCGKVQRYHRDALRPGVLPDIQFGPVGQREDANALALADTGVVELPELGALTARIPGMS